MKLTTILLILSAMLAHAATYLYPVQTTTNALSPSKAMVIDSGGKAAASVTTATEISYVSGVTAGIQGQINALIAGGGTNSVLLNGTNTFTGTNVFLLPVTATILGNATTATTATNFSGSLVGDVTGTQGATIVSTVGAQTAEVVAAGAVTANAGTNANTVSTLVKRDSSGNFTAGTITATLTGNASTATTATNSPGGNIDTNLALKAPLASPTFTGIVTATNIANALGLVGTPSYTFTGDTDTGLWSSGANTLNFSTGGSERVRVDSSGRLCIGSTAGAQLITINSDASLAALAFQIGSSTKAFYGVSYNADDPIVGMTSGDLGFRVQSNDLFFSGNGGSSGQLVVKASGNVGVGTIVPAYLIDTSGDVRVPNSKLLYLGGTAGTANADASIGRTAAGVVTVTTNLVVTGTITTGTQTKTSSYTLLTGDGDVTFADATGGAVTITLPAASSSTIGRQYQIFKVDSSGNAVTVAPNGSDTLLAGSTTSTTAQANCLRVTGYSATAWIVNKTQ